MSIAIDREAPSTHVETGIVPRSTIEAIVSLRDTAIRKYAAAYAALAAAKAAIAEANAASNAASDDRLSSYNYSTDKTRRDFLCKLEVPDRDQFAAAARRLVDIGVWSRIIEMTELEAVMDKEEKDRLRSDLHDDPPEVTVDNVRATLERFVADADTIWKRGIANCFSKLDRRFRSHDGWKIGSRIILDRAFGDWGSWNFYRNHQDTLIDVERAFRMLDGERGLTARYGSVVQAIDFARRGTHEPHQSELETPYFKIRIYKNGNCHIWFRRDDLVDKVNLLLADYYGEVLADDTDEGEDAALRRPKTALAKNYAHFPTPPDVAEKVIEAAMIYDKTNGAKPAVLEPSAGAGNLASLAAAKGADVDCIEVQPHLALALDAAGRYRRVWEADFLTVPPIPGYDRVVMNPPFDLERDIDHVMHAMRFLKPEGMLVAIMSAGTEWRGTKKARAFRDHMANLNAQWRDLPPGSFASVGTNINTVILRVRADGRQLTWWH